MLDGSERRTLTLFITLSVLGGGNAVGVRFSNRELEPLWGAAVRFVLAAAIAFVVVRVMSLPMPRGRALAGAMLYGLFAFGGAFAFAYYGLVNIQAGLGQAILALTPLATLLLAVVHRQERLSGWPVIGTLLAVAGIAIATGAAMGDAIPVLSVLALGGAALCFGEGTVIVRQFPPVQPVVMNAVGMGVGAAFLLGLSVVVGEERVLPVLLETWLAIGFLVLVGTLIVFGLYVVVLRSWSASRASYTFVVLPIVTVGLSAWLDNEPMGVGLIGGGLLVLVGVYLGALRPANQAAAQTVRK